MKARLFLVCLKVAAWARLSGDVNTGVADKPSSSCTTCARATHRPRGYSVSSAVAKPVEVLPHGRWLCCLSQSTDKVVSLCMLPAKVVLLARAPPYMQL